MKIKETVIHMHRMRFAARHGVLPQETAVGAMFCVDLQLTVSAARSALFEDSLEGTVDYARVYDAVRREMAVPSKLLERVAARIAEALLVQFPPIARIRIRLTKEVPPIVGFDGGGVSVELDVERDEAFIQEMIK